MVAPRPKEALTTYELLRRHGVSRRDFMQFCAMTACAMGLPPTMISPRRHCPGDEAADTGHLAARPRVHVLQRVVHPLVAPDRPGHHPQHDLARLRRHAAGGGGSPGRGDPQGADSRPPGRVRPGRRGQRADQGRRRVLHRRRRDLREHPAGDRRARASSSSPGARAHPTAACRRRSPIRPGAVPVHELIHDKPIVNVPGCPPIAEVMTGVLTYVLTFDRLPELDRIGRPEDVLPPAHSRQVLAPGVLRRRAVRRGVGRRGRQARAGASTRWAAAARQRTTPARTFKWNNGVSFPIGSGHGCIGCSEANFWDNGPFYERLSSIPAARHRVDAGSDRHGGCRSRSAAWLRSMPRRWASST